MAALMAVVAVLLLAVVSVGGYLAYRDGWLDRVVALVAPADSTPTGATPQPAPPAIAELPSPQPVVLPEAVSPEASPALASLPRLPAPAETAPATYSDPFAYCGAVGTLDYVDQRYIGPAVTEDMTSALQLPAVATRDRVHWRCSGGKVLACASYIGPICDMVPTSEEMTAFCARYPNAAQLMAPGGVWSCVAGSPQLPPEARWPVDARGFRADSWYEVKPVAMPAG